MNERPFYDGTVARIVALSGLEVKETVCIDDQRTKVAELQKHGISKTASLVDEKALTNHDQVQEPTSEVNQGWAGLGQASARRAG